MSKDILINHTTYETRIAIMEDGLLSEVLQERSRERGIVGNIYKGRVLKVFPTMEASFVDIGLGKSAFLFVDDVAPASGKEDLDNLSFNSTRGRARKQSIPIDKLLSDGQEILVQVSKAPISTKGARITCHPSIPGRNLVYMPTMTSVGVSRQISDEKERTRLKHMVNDLRPPKASFIVRTVAEGRSEDEFQADIHYLLSQWSEIQNRYERASSPSLIYQEMGLTFRILRDHLSDTVKRVLIDNPDEFEQAKKFLKEFLPHRKGVIELYKAQKPLFDHYNIEEEINRMMATKVWLPSGGYLVIEHAEALTCIDVNTGRFVGKSSHEDTILQTNLEAVKEVVRQLKLRNIGGIIIIDFIDMENLSNRQQVYKLLKDELRADRARTKILQISEIGLVEMTRKRDQENISQQLSEACPYCAGSGRIKSLSTVSHEVMREINRIKNKSSLIIRLHPDVAEHVTSFGKEYLVELEQKAECALNWQSDPLLHHEQFEIFER